MSVGKCSATSIHWPSAIFGAGNVSESLLVFEKITVIISNVQHINSSMVASYKLVISLVID